VFCLGFRGSQTGENGKIGGAFVFKRMASIVEKGRKRGKKRPSDLALTRIYTRSLGVKEKKEGDIATCEVVVKKDGN